MWVIFTSTVTGFSKVEWMGLLFGSGYYVSAASTNVGVQTMNYEYRDRYGVPGQIGTGSFQVVVN